MHHVIVGGGIAAVSAVKTIREYDRSCRITVISEERHCFYYRPMTPLVIKGDKERDDLLQGHRGLDIHLIHGRAASLDAGKREIVLDNGGRIRFDRLLIATGSSPRIPDIAGITEPGVHYLRTMDDAGRIRDSARNARRAVILGGGFVGIKKAEALARLGLDVTVVEQEDHILLPRLDETGAAMVAGRLTSRGITFIHNETVSEILPGARGVRLASGNELACDFVCIAAGVEPNIGWLEGSGIRTGMAIITDASMQTSVEGVYAAGDVVQTTDLVTGRTIVSALWTNAVEMGKVAGVCMAGGKIRYAGGLEVFNATEIEGLPIISIGNVMPDGTNDYQVTGRQGPQTYRKLVIKNDSLAGAIFIGDIDQAGICTALIKTGRPLGRLKERFISGSVSYADFYLNR